MSLLVKNGFDIYGNTDINLVGPYTGYLTTPKSQTFTSLYGLLMSGDFSYTQFAPTSTGMGYITLVPGLSSTGYALMMMAGSQGSKVSVKSRLPGNYATLNGGVWINANLQSRFGVIFYDNGSIQCSISVNTTTGTISLTSGDVNGTVTATSTVSIFSGMTHVLEWQITFGTSATYTIYLDKVAILTGTANTRNGTTNAYVNEMAIAVAGDSYTGYAIFDNLYISDTSGTVNNAPLLDGYVVDTTFPASNNSVQMTAVSAYVGTPYSGSPNTNAPGANYLFLRKVTPLQNCTVNNVSCVPQATSTTVNFKAAIYSDSSNSPGSLLSTGPAVTGCTTGVTVTGALTTPQSLTAGTSYWIGFITDTSIALQLSDDTTTAGVKVSATYTSGAPSSPSGFTVNQSSWQIWGVCSSPASNTQTLAQGVISGGVNAIQAASVGLTDYYNFPSSASWQAVYSTSVKAHVGTKGTKLGTVSLHMKSGSTDGTGSASGISIPPVPYWVKSEFVTDPNTGLAWTSAGLNAALVGISKDS